MALLVVFLLSAVVGGVTAYSTGAPSQACDTLAPQHPGGRQNNAARYVIDMTQFRYRFGFWYAPGRTYTLVLSAPNGQTFRGFFVRAHLLETVNDTTIPAGTFAVVNSTYSRLSSCSPPESGITHNNPDSISFSSMMMNWTAPANGTGPIEFVYAVVQTYTTYWVKQRGNTLSEMPLEDNDCALLPCGIYWEDACVEGDGPGNFSCEYCSEGYFITSLTNPCQDINECLSISCGEDEVCYNTPGSYMCRCQYGLTRNTTTEVCEDVNECLSYPCRDNETCTNTRGSYLCDEHTRNTTTGVCEGPNICLVCLLTLMALVVAGRGSGDVTIH